MCRSPSGGELPGWWEPRRVSNTEPLLSGQSWGSRFGALTASCNEELCHLPWMLSGVERSLYEHQHTELFWWFRKQSAPCGWILCWLPGAGLWHRLAFFPGAEWHTRIQFPGTRQLSRPLPQVSSVCTKRKPAPRSAFPVSSEAGAALLRSWLRAQQSFGQLGEGGPLLVLGASFLGFPGCASFSKDG